ncbi:RagB/SusD family nutrient uptake outer membrane protein [Fibrisoma montanum]|uniref:RagB/SusD family nutrient uptake outer membrane protein n=1 Tax=Fibrisoma montanum TaxID=2305895 RepID=A0A418MIP0_9BACT|nr:RagB/SusD family nutrient uptake outer membrane protein [Fibrisoma montanum]RIV27223.1 RagB/SusD family nutrient uptake outer membrane protein [Fibrisoma montanum]
MNTIKKWISGGLATAGLLMLNACGEDFLTRTPQGTFNPNAVTDARGIDALLTGAYGMLDGIPSVGPSWHGAGSNWVFGEIPSDNAYKGTDAGDQPEQTAIERYVWTVTNEHVRGKWRTLYNGVARTNDVLDNLALVEDLDTARRRVISAEARFLRGFYHFEAKKMWNNIPFIDEQDYNKEVPDSAKVPNTEDAWPRIEADFMYAMQNLPDAFPGEPGRATRWAAMGMLAKSYLYQGFDPYTGAPNPQKLQQALTLFNQIIASNRFALMDRYGDNFSAAPANRNNRESIFEIQYSVTSSAGGGGGLGDELAWPYNTGPGGCCGFYQPSQNLVNAYKTDASGLPLINTFNETDVTSDQGLSSDQPFTPYAGTLDPRLDHTVGRRGIPYKDWGVHPGRTWVRDQAYAGPYSPKKHIPERQFFGVNPGNNRLHSNNYRYMRLSQVLLWAAECEVEVGSLTRARDLVNQIRRRAANPDGFVRGADGAPAANYVVREYPAGAPQFATKEAARNAVRFEERLETSMEGHRFFDLVRWGIAEPTLNAYLTKERTQRTYLSGATFTKNRNEFYPIPFEEILNSAINGQPTLRQNQGYQ